MLAQVPDISGLGERRLLQLRIHVEVVFLDLLVVDVAEQLADLRSLEAREVQVEVDVFQVLQQICQHLIVPRPGDLVESDVQCLLTGLVHIDHGAGHFGVTQVNGHCQPLMATYNRHVRIHDQRVGKTEFPDAVLDLLVLLVPLFQLLPGIVCCRFEY